MRWFKNNGSKKKRKLMESREPGDEEKLSTEVPCSLNKAHIWDLEVMTIGDCFDYIAEYAEMKNPGKEKFEKQLKKTLMLSKKKGEIMAGGKIKGITIEIGGNTQRYKMP